MKANTMSEYKAKQERIQRGVQQMKALREKVIAHLGTLFQLELFQLSDMPLLPGGVTLRDQAGNAIVFYWDILTGQIKDAI